MSICCDHLAHIEEIAKQIIASAGKPSYTFGRDGNHPDGTWLDADGKPSNKVGIPFGLNNGTLIELWIGNENLTEFTVGLYEHEGDEVNLTLLASVTVPNTVRSKIFTAADFGSVSVSKGFQIAAQVISSVGGVPRRTGCHATILGTA